MEVTLTTTFIVGIALIFGMAAAIGWKRYFKEKEKKEQTETKQEEKKE